MIRLGLLPRTGDGLTSPHLRHARQLCPRSKFDPATENGDLRAKYRVYSRTRFVTYIAEISHTRILALVRFVKVWPVTTQGQHAFVRRVLSRSRQPWRYAYSRASHVTRIYALLRNRFLRML